MSNQRIKILKDAIKWIDKEGKERRTKVWYSKGGYTKESGLGEDTITIYGKEYKGLPRELNPENNSDIMTDYFEDDRAIITPKSKYYKDVLKAMQGKEESRRKREAKKNASVEEVDANLMNKIKKLAQAKETNTILDYEMSGYMKDSVRRKIFRNSAKHKLQSRRKYISINQMINGLNSGGSGVYLVETTGADKGMVWGHKAYGQKGYPYGDIDKVLKDIEDGNQNLIKMVKKRSLERRKK